MIFRSDTGPENIREGDVVQAPLDDLAWPQQSLLLPE